jgi:hypothetical protein
MRRLRDDAAFVIIGVLATALLPLPSNAQQRPAERCVSVSKTEYDSVRKASLNNRFGTYLRTGAMFRRYYWYCPLISAEPDRRHGYE